MMSNQFKYLKLTPVKQFLPSRKSKTGDRLSTLVCSNGVLDDGDRPESSTSPRAAATTLFMSGSISLVNMSDFRVPSYNIRAKILIK